MKRGFMAALLALAVTAALPAVSFAVPVPAKVPAKPAPKAPAKPDASGIVKVELDTTKGPIIVALETKKAPITTANFLRYLDAGKLVGAPFWRAAHSGDTGFIQATMKAPTFPPIAHEPTSKTGLSHVNGELSMSRFDVGTATADFVICIGDNTYMDAGHHNPADNQGYAAFGHVVSGMNVVRSIQSGRIDKHTGPGGWKGQMLAKPILITAAKRL